MRTHILFANTGQVALCTAAWSGVRPRASASSARAAKNQGGNAKTGADPVWGSVQNGQSAAFGQRPNGADANELVGSQLRCPPARTLSRRTLSLAPLARRTGDPDFGHDDGLTFGGNSSNFSGWQRVGLEWTDGCIADGSRRLTPTRRKKERIEIDVIADDLGWVLVATGCPGGRVHVVLDAAFTTDDLPAALRAFDAAQAELAPTVKIDHEEVPEGV